MKLTKLFRKTLLHKIYSTIYWGYQYISDKSIISGIFYSNSFNMILEKYLNTKFKKDWIGRLYGVINPHIDIDGKFDFSNTIIEIDGSNTNSDVYVQTWVYKQMALVKYVCSAESSGLFDYIGATITHVGPNEHDNYLIVFDIVSRKEFTRYLKSAMKHMLVYAILIFSAYLSYKFCVN